ncbi:MAG TPA: hypothetical protein VFA05_07045 [Gaiellaceae bacterium]|nr:hypothetical protein [Gaiellaceae bacterium]
MAVTICVGDEQHDIPADDAATLAEQLRLYADGFRGEISDPAAARNLADEIGETLARKREGPIRVDDLASLDALHTVLNSIVHEVGPAMRLYSAVVGARRRAA